MNNIPPHTETPNNNVLPFKPGCPAAPSNAQIPDDASTAVGMPETAVGMPEGYVADETGIFELRETEEGDALPTHICSPLVVKGRCRDVAGKGWGLVLAVRDPDGTWHELVLGRQQLNKSANAALAPLFDVGFELQPVEKAAKSVMKLLQTWHTKDRYCRFVWRDNLDETLATIRMRFYVAASATLSS